MKRQSSLDLLWEKGKNRTVNCKNVSSIKASANVSSPKSEFIGVSWDVFSYKWKAHLSLETEGERIFLGLFENDRDAAMCVNQKCIEQGLDPPNEELLPLKENPFVNPPMLKRIIRLQTDPMDLNKSPKHQKHSSIAHIKREPGEALKWEVVIDKWRGELVEIQDRQDKIMKNIFDCEQDLLFIEAPKVTSSMSSVSSGSFGSCEILEGAPCSGGEELPDDITVTLRVNQRTRRIKKRSPEAKQLKTMPVWYPARSRHLTSTLSVEPTQRRHENVEYIHCFIIGSKNAGKLSLIDRYIYDDFLEVHYRRKIFRTISSSAKSLETHRAPFVKINHEAFCPMIHNSSGVHLTRNFFQTSYLDSIDAFVFVYNIADRNSFEELQSLYELVYTSRRSRGIEGALPAILVGTSLDLASPDHSKDRFIWDLAFSHLRSMFNFEITCSILSYIEKQDSIPWFEGWTLAKRWNLPFIETSSKTGFNVDEAFCATLREAQNPMLRLMSDFTLHRKRSFVNNAVKKKSSLKRWNPQAQTRILFA